MNKNKIKTMIALTLTMSTLVMAGGCGSENTYVQVGENSRDTALASQSDTSLTEESNKDTVNTADSGFASEKELVSAFVENINTGSDISNIYNSVDVDGWAAYVFSQNHGKITFSDAYTVAADLDKGADYINQNYSEFAEKWHSGYGEYITDKDIAAYDFIENKSKLTSDTINELFKDLSDRFAPVEYEFDESKIWHSDSGYSTYRIPVNSSKAPEITELSIVYFENNRKIFFIFCSEVYGDRDSSSDATPANSEEINSDETEKNFDNSWTGVYRYDDGKEGELLLISLSSYKVVRGTYVFGYDNGGYGSRDFTWYLRDQNEAVESFGNGDGTVIYYLKEGKITAQYPDGWWDDRDYIYICEVDEARQQIKHTYFDNRTESTADSSSPATDGHHTPFYGIWIAASKERSDCESVVQELQNKGFSADIYVTTDWSNLNPEKWYVVTAGIYSTQEEADRALPNIQAAGYNDAYVKEPLI